MMVHHFRFCGLSLVFLSFFFFMSSWFFSFFFTIFHLFFFKSLLLFTGTRLKSLISFPVCLQDAIYRDINHLLC